MNGSTTAIAPTLGAQVRRAVDIENCAREACRRIERAEGHYFGYFVRRRYSPQRLIGDDGGISYRLRDSLRRYPSRRNHINEDTLRCQRLRQGLAHRIEPSLTRSVRGSRGLTSVRAT